MGTRTFWLQEVESIWIGKRCLKLSLKVNVKSEICDTVVVTFHWQADEDIDRWYACEAGLISSRGTDFGTAGKLLQELDISQNIQPQELMNVLESKGFVHVAYHKGLGQFIPVKEWPQWDTWRIPRAATDTPVNRMVTARTAEEAIEEFEKVAMQAIKVKDRYRAFWLKWLQNPVVEHHSAPETLGLPSIQLPWIENAAEYVGKR